jgi:signal peptidase I
MVWTALFIVLFLPISFTNTQVSKAVVRTGSMEPALQIGDTLEVDAGYYLTKSVKRFDVVHIERGEEGLPQHLQPFRIVARVIALGGETIAIKNNKLFINGVAVKEPHKIKPCLAEDEDGFSPCANFKSFKVPTGEFFLLGDNRADSEDSRVWKPHTIKREQIIGKVIKVTRNI